MLHLKTALALLFYLLFQETSKQFYLHAEEVTKSYWA